MTLEEKEWFSPRTFHSTGILGKKLYDLFYAHFAPYFIKTEQAQQIGGDTDGLVILGMYH